MKKSGQICHHSFNKDKKSCQILSDFGVKIFDEFVRLYSK